MSDLGYVMIPANLANYSRVIADKIWIIRHATATPYSDNYPQNLGLYWQRNAVQTSTQYAVSDTMVRQFVAHKYTCYATRMPGNARAVHIEYVGQAGWSRAQWLAHDGMLRRGAKLEVEISRKERISLGAGRNLTNAEFGAYKPGVATHHQHTQVFGGTHTDPGPGFPHDVVWKYIQEELAAVAAPSGDGDDMPKLTDEFLLAFLDPRDGNKQKTVKITYAQYLGLEYMQGQRAEFLSAAANGVELEENELLRKLLAAQDPTGS